MSYGPFDQHKIQAFITSEFRSRADSVGWVRIPSTGYNFQFHKPFRSEWTGLNTPKKQLYGGSAVNVTSIIQECYHEHRSGCNSSIGDCKVCMLDRVKFGFHTQVKLHVASLEPDVRLVSASSGGFGISLKPDCTNKGTRYYPNWASPAGHGMLKNAVTWQSMFHTLLMSLATAFIVGRDGSRIHHLRLHRVYRPQVQACKAAEDGRALGRKPLCNRTNAARALRVFIQVRCSR